MRGFKKVYIKITVEENADGEKLQVVTVHESKVKDSQLVFLNK